MVFMSPEGAGFLPGPHFSIFEQAPQDYIGFHGRNMRSRAQPRSGALMSALVQMCPPT